MSRVRVTVETEGAAELPRSCEIPGDVTPHDSLLTALEKRRVALPFGCRSGACGACLVFVVEGAELFEAADAVESDTLKRCGDSPERRLGCRLKLRAGASGAVRVRVPASDEGTPY